MKRIGIIGTENSHALHFAKSFNLPDPQTGERLYPDMKVVGVYGPDQETAEKVKAEAGADFIADSPEDFFGKVDAMMITSRKGSKHLEYALPFLEAGMPVFVDKPLTSNVEEAQQLIATAEKNGSLITGGSGCKYAWDVEILKSRADKLKATDELLSASINFAADTQSEYDGFFFYAPHLTEMALTIFGEDIQGLQAFESAGGVLTVLRYPAYDVSLHYTRNSSVSSATLYGKTFNVQREIDISMIYGLEVEKFAEILRTGKMKHSYAFYAQPVVIMDAILRSLEEGIEIKL